MNKKTFLGLVFFSVVIMVAMINWPYSVAPVGAQSTSTEDNELQGWAWSDSTGWVSFNHKQFNEEITPATTGSDDTGWKTPGLATQKVKDPNSLNWNIFGITNLTNLIAMSESVLRDVRNTNYLETRDFGFNIPSDANITGIEVCYLRTGGARKIDKVNGDTLYRVYDEDIRLIKPNGSYTQDNKSKTEPWELSPVPSDTFYEACYGGANDTWGENWTSSDIVNPNFGAVMSAYLPAEDYLSGATVKTVKVKVFYKQTFGAYSTSNNSNYAVKVDHTGNLTGYAWSLNLGWIKFAPELYPTGVCGATNDCYGAKIVEGGTIDEVKGWARVCSVYQSGCSGTLRSDAELGGWDGWIRMHNVKRQANGGYFGYAWGDLNLAWLNFGFGFSSDDGGPDDGTCDPSKQVCGGIVVACDSEQQCCDGDTYPENLNCGREATISVNGQCVGEALPFFDPDGADCGPYCRTYPVNQTVKVGFQGLEPGTISSWDSNGDPCVDNGDNSCTIAQLTKNTGLTANCVETPLSECSVMITSGTMSLVESKNLDYAEGPLSNAAKVVLKTDRGVPCQGTYNLESSILGDSANLFILCLKDGVYGEDCTGLDGASETLIKAKFTARPAISPSFWDVTMRATRDEESSQPKTYKNLIRYQRKAAN